MCPITSFLCCWIFAPAALLEAIAKHRSALAADVLATTLELVTTSGADASGAHVELTEIDGLAVEIVLKKRG